MTKQGAALFEFAAGLARQEAARPLAWSVSVELLCGGSVTIAYAKVKDFDGRRLSVVSTMSGETVECFGPEPTDGPSWTVAEQIDQYGSVVAIWRCEA